MIKVFTNIFRLTLVYQITKFVVLIVLLLLPDSEPVRIQETNNSKITYTSITGMITFTSGEEIIDVLNKAEYGEVVVININSQGGVMIQGMKIVKALNNTEATTICNVGKIAASMAAIIMNNCQYINLDKDSAVIYHMPYMYIPYVGAVRATPINEMFLKYYRDEICLDNSFTKQEWDDLLIGQDIYFDEKSMARALKNTCVKVKNERYYRYGG